MSTAPCIQVPRVIVLSALLLLAGCGPSKTELAHEIATLKEQLQARSAEVETLKGQLSSLQTEIDTGRKALADAKAAEQVAIDQASARTQRTEAQARENVEALQRELDGTKRARDDQLAHLRHQLEQARQTEQTITAEREALIVELASIKDQQRALDAKFQSSTGELEHAQRLAADLTEKLARVIGERTHLQGQTDAQRTELAAITAALNDAQGKAARLSGARGIYTVQDGDSLSSIALYFYRNAYRWPGILDANKHLINHPDRIFPAMVLIVPK